MDKARRRAAIVSWTASCLTLLLLQACQTTPPQPARAPVAMSPEAAARRLESQGQYAAAARAYEELAGAAGAERREELLASAVTALLRGGDVTAATQLFERTQGKLRSPQGQLRARLLEAELLLIQGDTEGASRALGGLTPELAGELGGRAHLLRAELFSLQGRPLEAAHERLRADAQISDPRLREYNQRQLLLSLMATPDHTLTTLESPPPDTLGGWVALARILRDYSRDPERGRARLAQWRASHSGHPAGERLLASLSTEAADRFRWPAQIALLVPETGELGPAGAALRDGFLAAYFAQQEPSRPLLRIYDTAGAEATTSLYRRAVSEGAGLVVGPLSKEAVTALRNLQQLPVAVLALNYTAAGARGPANLFEFGLAPEDEARQAAEWAYAQGGRNAAVLVVEGPWGDRVLGAFERRWRELGGKRTEHRRFAPEQTDLSAVLRGLSPQTTGAGADFLFLGAFPAQAQRLRSQLAEAGLGELPVYATSHIFSGVPNSRRDRDLDGILFCDIPWLLGEDAGLPESVGEMMDLWPETTPTMLRLYAMGMDAYRLAGQIEFLRRHPQGSLPGSTGELSLRPDGRVFRRLLWARFDSGLPKAVGATPLQSSRAEILDALYGGGPPKP